MHVMSQDVDPVAAAEDDRSRPVDDAVEAALGELGDRWKFLLLREAFFGVRRFSDFRDNLGISRKVLSQRLVALVAAGLMVRTVYQDRPTRHEYRLSEKGRDLYGVIVALMQWGERWVLGAAPIRLQHRTDGGQVEARVTCQNCHQTIDVRDIEWRPAPERN